MLTQQSLDDFRMAAAAGEGELPGAFVAVAHIPERFEGFLIHSTKLSGGSLTHNFSFGIADARMVPTAGEARRMLARASIDWDSFAVHSVRPCGGSLRFKLECGSVKSAT